MSVMTFCPVSAANVSGVINSLRGARHHHLHVELFLLQTAHQFGGFIRRNSTSDPKSNLHRNRNGGGQLLAPFSVLVFVLGGVHRFGRSGIRGTPLQFFFGNARGLARFGLSTMGRPPIINCRARLAATTT